MLKGVNMNYPSLKNYPECITGLFWLTPLDKMYKSNNSISYPYGFPYGEKADVVKDPSSGKYVGISSQQCCIDPTKKTLIFFHGWRPNTTANKHVMTLPNAVKYFINDGWNVGYFRWQAYSDDDHPYFKNEHTYAVVPIISESKIYSNRNNMMRYIDASGTNTIIHTDTTTTTITDLFVKEYSKYFDSSSHYSNEIRFVGHSLGSQLATNCAVHVNANYNLQHVSRIDLLDPFFCGFSPYFDYGQEKDEYVHRCGGGKMTYHNVLKLTENNNVAVSWFQCSPLTNITADELMKNVLNIPSVFESTFKQVTSSVIFADENSDLKAIVAYQRHKFWYLPLTTTLSELVNELLEAVVLNKPDKLHIVNNIVTCIRVQNVDLHNEIRNWYFNSYIIGGTMSSLAVYKHIITNPILNTMEWRMCSDPITKSALSSMNTTKYIIQNMNTNKYRIQISKERINDYITPNSWWWVVYIYNGFHSFLSPIYASTQIENDKNSIESFDNTGNGGNYTTKIGDDVFTLRTDWCDNEWNDFFFHNNQYNEKNGIPYTE